MTTFISHSPSETESLGEAWGRDAQRGLVIALSGDLGAGKTQLVRGLARGLGYTGRIHSPTFTLVNTYEGGRLPLFHLDLYRLETMEQIHGAGVDEYLQPDGVAVIEWAERIVEREARNAERGTQELPGGASVLASRMGENHPAPPTARGDTRPTFTQDATRNTRFVTIEIVDETTRRIVYEDTGA